MSCAGVKSDSEIGIGEVKAVCEREREREKEMDMIVDKKEKENAIDALHVRFCRNTRPVHKHFSGSGRSGRNTVPRRGHLSSEITIMLSQHVDQCLQHRHTIATATGPLKFHMKSTSCICNMVHPLTR
jgi:hypothetical protein